MSTLASADGKRIALGASAAFVGIALSVLELQSVGGILTVAGLVGLGWSIHRFGRSGAE